MMKLQNKWIIGSLAFLLVFTVSACSNNNSSKAHQTKSQVTVDSGNKEKDQEDEWYKENERLIKKFGKQHIYVTNYLFNNPTDDKWKQTAIDYFKKMRISVSNIIAHKPINKKTETDYSTERKAYTNYIKQTDEAEKQIRSGNIDAANGTLTDANTKLQNALNSN